MYSTVFFNKFNKFYPSWGGCDLVSQKISLWVLRSEENRLI